MKYNKTVGMVSIHIDTKRIDDNVRRAQDLLDQQVLNDMVPYMPESQQSAMVSATHIIEPGLIATDTPYAHYQYEGLLRTDEEGRVVVGEGKRKPILTDTLLHYSKTGAIDHWFEHAKQEHGEQWLDLVRKEVGKG